MESTTLIPQRTEPVPVSTPSLIPVVARAATAGALLREPQVQVAADAHGNLTARAVTPLAGLR